MITTTYLIDAWNATEGKIECFPLVIRSLTDYSEVAHEFAPSGQPYKIAATLLAEKGLSDSSIVSVHRIDGVYTMLELEKIMQSAFLSRCCEMVNVYDNVQLRERIEKMILGIEDDFADTRA